MCYVDIQRLAIYQDAGDLRHHVPCLEVEVSSFDYGKASQQRFAFNRGQAVYSRLLDQIIIDAPNRSDIPLQLPRCLPGDAHFVERYDVRLEDLHALDDEGTTFIPPL